MGARGADAWSPIVGLAHSHRGLTGSISHAVSALTNPNAKPPPNTPGRLTAVASVRARYWKEALQVFGAHPALGAGAEGYATARLRYRKETLVVTHAHGFVVQTLADLGIVGLLVALALLGSWMALRGDASVNRRGPLERARPSASAPATRRERELAHTLSDRHAEHLCVVVFGVHSLIDWTWYVPGDACVALLCAGWLVGRGPLDAAQRWRAPTSNRQSLRWRDPGQGVDPRLLVAGLVVAAALLVAWTQWQPQRSEEARQQALTLAEAGKRRASVEEAHTAVSRDPVSAEARLPWRRCRRPPGSPRAPATRCSGRCACSRRTRRPGSNWRVMTCATGRGPR